jgi:hypothetical protein
MNDEDSKQPAPYLPYSTFETGINHIFNLGGIPPTPGS